MTERMIVAFRCEKMPPPGSSERFSCTLESITTISPLVVIAAPGPSLPPRVRVTSLISRKPVPFWLSSRFSKQVCLIVCPLPSSVSGRSDSRIGSPVRHERMKMSALSSIPVTRGSAHAVRSSASVSTTTGASPNHVYLCLTRRAPSRQLTRALNAPGASFERRSVQR